MAKPPSPMTSRALGLLLPLGPVRARAMFSGWGIYLDDVMFALVAWERLFFRTDGQTRARFLEAGGEPFVYQGRSGPVEMPYAEAPPGSLAHPDALQPWAELGLAAAKRARAAKATRKKR